MSRAELGNFSAAVRGFSLVAAIFVLVVLAALGVFIVTIGEVERSTATAAVQGARAYEAAQSGIEWGINQVLSTTTRIPPVAAAPGCSAFPLAPTALAPTFAVGLFQVSVTCSYWDIQEGGLTGSSTPITPGHYYVYLITSTATFGSFTTRDYFARTTQATVTDAP